MTIPRTLRDIGADLVLETTNFGPFFVPSYAKSMTVIHDITPVLFPQWHTFNGWFWQKLLLKSIVKKADLIFTVSHHTKNDIIDTYSSDYEKIVPIHLGVNESYEAIMDEQILEKFEISNPYLLTVGTIEPRKNHKLILDAFAEISDTQLFLVIVGGIGWKSEAIISAIDTHPKRDQIILTGYVSEYEKKVLYSQCEAMIYASHYEGFGLPVIEAGACGAYSFVAYNSSLKELANPLTKYFENKAELIELIGQLPRLKNDEYQIESAKEIKATFNWQKYGESFSKVIHERLIETDYSLFENQKSAVIIVNWNGLSDTQECIESVLRSSLYKTDIYIIDNDSDNMEGQTLSHSYASNPLITIIQNHDNFGFTGGHNSIWHTRLKSMEYDNLILLNNDTTVDEDWFTELLRTSVTSDLDIVAAKMLHYHNHKQIDSIGHFVLANGEILPAGHNQRSTSHKSAEKNIGGSGGGVLYKASMINNIGFFDHYFHTGYEDAEYGLRAYLAGYDSGLAPDSHIYHKGGVSIKKIFNQEYAVRTQINILYTMFKLFPPVILIFGSIINILRLLVILIGGIILGKKEIVKTLIKAYFIFFKTELPKALKARKEFKPLRKRNSIHLFLISKSFITFDIKRAIRILFKKTPSAVDQYR